VSELRHIPDPPGITTARTLPAAWYSDAAHFDEERRAVFGTSWTCVGAIDELPAPGAWTAVVSAGAPVLIVRDRGGELRAFLNVCRHRAAPLCDTGDHGTGPLIRCPYHAWLYRLDGSLAKASGVGEPEAFDLAEHSLTPVGIATWRRWVFVRIAGDRGQLDLGPLARAIDAFRIEELEVEVSEMHVRPFNWKVLLENYSENYHTPFVHPEIDTSSSEDYPMVSDGPVLYAWDRALRPGDVADEQLRATLLPGEPGWEALATARTDRPYDVGSYLTVWPNLMINVFPDAVLGMWVDPLAANVTRVERRLYVRPGMASDTRAAIIAAHRLVHDQDVDICARVQRSHDAGLDAHGRLATVEERGVFWIHEQVRAALRASARSMR
jgi:Rieske 2Fe-2S family protein